MKRKGSVLATICSLLLLSGSMVAQAPQAEPSPALPSSVLGSDLIAWSQMQTPRPMPQPLPHGQKPRAQQQPAPATLVGTIVKLGGSYFLRVPSGASYHLNGNDETAVKQYDGKQVKLVGNEDDKSRSLHVLSIQPM